VRETQTFPPDAKSVPAARRFATRLLAGSGPDVLQAGELMVSELATNCVRHGATRFDLTIQRTPEEIRVEVTDHGGGTPAVRSPGPDEPTGRGLRIVDMLSDQWGVVQRVRGKTVWFTLALGPSERSGGQGAWSQDPKPQLRDRPPPALDPAPVQDPPPTTNTLSFSHG
jgi:anti-sigma regulatory factor (Ser/Thr protein kinase)